MGKAQEKKFDFDQKVLTLGKAEMVDKDNHALTLKDLCITAIIESYPDERPTGQEKRRRGQLARQIYAGGVVSISSEDIEKIKVLVGKHYPPLIVDSIWDTLEGPGEVEPSTPNLAIAPEPEVQEG